VQESSPRRAGAGQSLSSKPTEKTIRVGNVSFRIVSDHPGFWRHADRRYARFYVPGDDAPDETVALHVVPGEAPHLPRQGADKTEIQVESDRIRMVRGRAVGVWEKDRHRARVEQRASDFETEEKIPDYACDSFVRVILCHHLLDRGALLVHSAGIARGDDGYVFAGRSGAGKSTVARLSADMSRILADDVTIVSPHGQHGALLSGTPYCGALTPGGRNETVPLRGFYFLRQAHRNQRRRLSRPEAISRLLQSVVFFDESPDATASILDNVDALSARVPCYELEFVKDASFWRCIDD